MDKLLEQIAAKKAEYDRMRRQTRFPPSKRRW
jgi:hypothetical protein